MGGQAKQVTGEVMSRLIISILFLTVQSSSIRFITVSASCLAGCNRAVSYLEGLRPILSEMATVWTG